jgi:hypothetical protein
MFIRPQLLTTVVRKMQSLTESAPHFILQFQQIDAPSLYLLDSLSCISMIVLGRTESGRTYSAPWQLPVFSSKTALIKTFTFTMFIVACIRTIYADHHAPSQLPGRHKVRLFTRSMQAVSARAQVCSIRQGGLATKVEPGLAQRR